MAAASVTTSHQPRLLSTPSVGGCGGRLSTSAACLATSVPRTPIATPTSAARSAGASLTPSPVIATTWPARCHAVMMPSFSAGSVRAYTGRSSASGAVGASPARVTPVRAATAAAVLGWSPVIMMGRMPAARAASTAARASGRTGSASATRPSIAGLPGGPAAIASTR